MSDGLQMLRTLDSKRQQLHTMQEELTRVRMEASTIEQNAIKGLMSIGKRWIDIGETGHGPYWVITKKQSDGAFSKDHIAEFCSDLLDMVYSRSQDRVSVGEGVALYNEGRRSTEKRQLQLKLLMVAPRKNGVQDLIQWMDHKDQ